jgi:uncharacterized membrane protein YcgQ (UPF0703/DUF1980 family)
MKKKVYLLIAAVLLSGCQAKAAVLTVTNGNGTPAVNITQITTTAPAVTTTADTTVYSDYVPSFEASVPLVSDGEVIEIKDKLFVAQTNELYVNAADYLGKTIKYEGIFVGYTWENNGTVYYSVIRYGPGCCGNDANCGLEVKWTDEQTEYPNQDDWVEVVGVLEEYEEDGYKYLRLALTSLTVLDTRGNEFVTQ